MMASLEPAHPFVPEHPWTNHDDGKTSDLSIVKLVAPVLLVGPFAPVVSFGPTVV